MSGDLLVITPSRGRPFNAGRLTQAVEQTRELKTDVVILLDEDDPRLDDYRDLPITYEIGPRKAISELTNDVALREAGNYKFLASYGDDHIPRTQGWDRLLCQAIDDMGGTGYAYAAGSRWVIPEGIVVSSDIVAELGWLSLPTTAHYKLDDAWLQLGLTAGCIRYLPGVLVEHMQFGIPYDPMDLSKGFKSVLDPTYQEALTQEAMNADLQAWYDWQADGLEADAARVRKLIEAKLWLTCQW